MKKPFEINCCKDCVAPKRQLGCHDRCEEYKEEKAEMRAKKEKVREEKKKYAKISNFQYDKIASHFNCKTSKRYKH